MGNECAVIPIVNFYTKRIEKFTFIADPSKIQESLKKCSKTKHARKTEKDRDREGGKEIKNVPIGTIPKPVLRIRIH